MKKAVLPLLLGLSLAVAVTSCTPKGPVPSPTAPVTAGPLPSPVTAAPSPAPTAAAVPAPRWGTRESTCSQSDESDPAVLLVSGKFQLPVIENADGIAAYEAINDYYLDLSAGLRTDTLANAPFAADDYAASKVVGYEFFPYTDEETSEITYESAGLVSILRTHYGHTGGVYPQLLYMAEQFDLATGEELAFADFFTDPDQAEGRIKEAVLQQAAENENYDQDAAEQFFRREDFYLTDSGFVFFYQPEVLSPHAAGAAEFAIPYEALEGLLVVWK